MRYYELLEANNNNPGALAKLKNQWLSLPSEQVQLEAVNQDGMAIQLISNPLEVIQLEAVKQNGLVVQSIDYPLEGIQLEAVKHNPGAYRLLDNPTPKVTELYDQLMGR